TVYPALDPALWPGPVAGTSTSITVPSLLCRPEGDLHGLGGSGRVFQVGQGHLVTRCLGPHRGHQCVTVVDRASVELCHGDPVRQTRLRRSFTGHHFDHLGAV